MATTTDPDDGCLREIGPDGMQRCYLVLPDGKRRLLVLPVRTTYRHLDCGTTTRMGRAIAETYAAMPVGFYGATYCAQCGGHFPVGEKGRFIWSEPCDAEGLGTLVGTVNVRPAGRRLTAGA